MTRALFVSHTAHKSGAEMFLNELLQGSGEDWRACFLSDGAVAQELQAAGIPVSVLTAGQRMLAVRKGSSIFGLFGALLDVVAAARAVAKEARQVDVIWANSQKSLFVCAIASVLSSRPLVWGLHDILLDGEFSRSNRTAAVFCSRLFAKIIAANSHATAQSYVASGGPERKIRLIYNGFEPAPENAGSDQCGGLRKELGLNAVPLVGLFGRISPWKGQNILIEAVAREAAVHAVIVGAPLFGEDAYLTELKALCSSLGVEKRVHFLGFRNDVRSIMGEMDIVAHCSTIPEPFGRVVVEGLMAGKPVIATRGGGVGEIISDGSTGLLVPPGDIDALHIAMQRLLGDPDLARKLAEAGKQHALAKFSLSASREAARAILHEAGAA